jgi:hypothetical protein
MMGSMRNAVSTLAEKSSTAAFNQANAASQNYAQSMREFYELGGQLGMSEGSSSSWNLGTNSSAAESYRKAIQLTDRFAHDHKLSFGEAARVLSAAHVDGQVGLGFGRGKGRGLSGGVSIGGRLNSDHTQSHDSASLYDEARTFVKDSGYSNHVDVVERAARDKQFRTNNEKTNRLAESMGASYDQGETLRHEALSSMQTAESYRNTASHMEERGGSYQIAMGQKFAEYVANQPRPDGGGAIGHGEGLSFVASHPELMQRYAERFMDNQVKSMIPQQENHLPHSTHDVHQDFARNNQHIKKSEGMHQQYNAEKNKINETHQAQQMLSKQFIDHSPQRTVEDQITERRQDVKQRHAETEQKGKQEEQKYRQEEHKKRSGGLIKNAFSGIDTKDDHVT